MGVAGTQTQFCVAVFTSRHRLDDHLVWLQLIPGSRPQTQLSQAEAVKSWLLSSLSTTRVQGRSCSAFLSLCFHPNTAICTGKHTLLGSGYRPGAGVVSWWLVRVWWSLSSPESLDLCSPLLNVSQIFQHHLIKYFFKITVLQKRFPWEGLESKPKHFHLLLDSRNLWQ